jgi:hypothetical protein
MFMASFNSTLDRYRGLLAAQKAGRLELPNQNFDVGEVTGAGTYKLSDDAYAHLLDKLEGHYTDMPSELRLDIVAFYGDLSAPISTKTNAGDWAKVIKELDELKATSVAAEGLQ